MNGHSITVGDVRTIDFAQSKSEITLLKIPPRNKKPKRAPVIEDKLPQPSIS